MKMLQHLAAGITLGFFTAWIAYRGWGWFVVPLGVPEISVIHAYGLTVLVKFMARQDIPEIEYEDDIGETFINGLSWQITLLLFMYLASLFVN